MNNRYVVLWTGGLDSTYRLCQLARQKNVIIELVYIVDPEREPCLSDELNAQKELWKYIVFNSNTKALIKPVKRVYRYAIPSSKDIEGVTDVLNSYGLGWQFIFIADFARWEKGCEICQEILWDFLKDRNVSFKQIDGRNYMCTDNLEKEFKIIFENLTFPIMGVPRLKMVKDLKKWGYKHVLDKVWFCYQGIDGKPCGFCENCRKKIQDGLKELFSEEAVHHYLMYRFVHNFQNLVAQDYFKEYCFYHGDYSKCIEYRQLNGGVKVYAKDCFENFKKLDRLSNQKLKELIINGSLEYGYRKSLKDKILHISEDVERKKMYEGLFKQAGI